MNGSPPLRERLQRLPIIGVCAALVIVIASVIVVALQLFPSHRVVVRNTGSSDVRNIQLTLQHLDGGVILLEYVARLAPGGEVVFRHRANDLSARLTFTIGGRKFACSEPYIDLWTGEGWVYAIDSAGSVRSGYESAGPQQLLQVEE
jgi:hypothetical protein